MRQLFLLLVLGMLTTRSSVADGPVVNWGGKFGQLDEAPVGQFQAVSAGVNHGLALKTDGEIVAWGYNAQGQLNAPRANSRPLRPGLSTAWD